MKCKRCGDWRNLYRMPILGLLFLLLRHGGLACGQACAECGRVLWGQTPKREPAEKTAARTIKRARYGVEA